MKMKAKLGGIILIGCLVLMVTGCNTVNDFDTTLGQENVGKTGPGGGIVIYWSQKGWSMPDDPGRGLNYHYLEVASQDLPGTYEWVSAPFYDAPINGNIGTALGSGRQNTLNIYNTDPNSPAAIASRNYKGKGKTDWYIPSRDELAIIWQERSRIKNLDGGATYWSSSRNGNTQAWGKSMVATGNTSLPRQTKNKIRLVRAF